MKKTIIFVIAILLMIGGTIYYINYSTDSIETLSKYGSQGDEVKQIQQKLKNWGYYTGSVDGIYGSKTQEAVRNFQKANGLTQDRNCRTSNFGCNGNKF